MLSQEKLNLFIKIRNSLYWDEMVVFSPMEMFYGNQATLIMQDKQEEMHE